MWPSASASTFASVRPRRLEARIFFEELLSRYPTYNLVGEVKYVHSTPLVRGAARDAAWSSSPDRSGDGCRRPGRRVPALRASGAEPARTSPSARISFEDGVRAVTHHM